MSWTAECIQTNCFKVKNPKEVKEVFELLGFTVYDYAETNKLKAFGSDEGGAWLDENAEVVLNINPFAQDGEMRNLHGIISDYTCESIDLDTLAEEFNYSRDELDNYVMVVPIIEYLQDQLLEDSYIEITNAGFECRSAGSSGPYGYVEIITKTQHKANNLFNLSKQLKEECGITKESEV